MRTPRIGRWLCSVAMVAAAATAPSAQSPAPAAAQATPQTSVATERIELGAGRSTVLTVEFDVVRIAVTDPLIADAVVVTPREVLIDGKSAGAISLIVWGQQTSRHYEVVVQAAASAVQVRLGALLPDEKITATTQGDLVILTGPVSNAANAARAADIAGAGGGVKVVNLLELAQGPGSQQVMLQVRFAEVSRRALRELGASFFTGPSGYKDWVGRSTTQQFAAPGFEDRIGPPPAANPTDEGKLTFSDFLNLFLFNSKYSVGAVIRALEEKGLFESLAEPNLIAYNGQEASFLAGGEIPIPVVQGVSGAVSVVFKEFGIRLKFKPRIVGDAIRLTVTPEVSTLDYANGLVLSGFRVPALSTRRAETEVELRDGQSFAIAGLMNHLSQEQIDSVPGISKIPLLGKLFSSQAKRSERTELMVLITPKLIQPMNAEDVPPLPVERPPVPPPANKPGKQP
jgi:pilus assembly protein CpaC